MTTRHALLGAYLALPLLAASSAMAASPPESRTITVPPGAVVLILPGAATVGAPPFTASAALQSGDPMLRLIAEQDAMMRDMMAQMDAAFAPPMVPAMDRVIQAALHGTTLSDHGVATVFTSMTNSPGVCSERVVYTYPATGGKPQVTVTRSGDGCGPIGGTGTQTISQPAPMAPSVRPAQGPGLWTVSDPPRPIETGTPRS